MKSIVLLLTLLQSSATPDIEQLRWLQGCWETVSPQRTVEEQWMAPRGGSMMGMSRTVRGGKLVEYETIVIRQQGNQLAYEAHPSGQRSAVFLSSAVTESMVVFENPQHDFPQKIGYQLAAGGTLLAWIEGASKGQSRRVEFPYRRASCPGPSSVR
jgi:hypothetical protein